MANACCSDFNTTTPWTDCANPCIANSSAGFTGVGTNGSVWFFLGGNPCLQANWTQFQLCCSTLTYAPLGDFFTHNDGQGNVTVVDLCCPTLTDNFDGTYTHDDGRGDIVIIDGNTIFDPAITGCLTATTMQSAIDQLSTRNRPFQRVGLAASAINCNSVTDDDRVFHTGDTIIGGTVPGNNAKFTVLGSTSLGANNHANQGGNSIASGSNNTSSGLQSSTFGINNVASGTNTFVAGNTSNVSGNNSAAVGGGLHAVSSINSIAGGGNTNVINSVGTDNSIFGGDNNTISGSTRASDITASSTSTITGTSTYSAIVASNSTITDSQNSGINSSVNSTVTNSTQSVVTGSTGSVVNGSDNAGIYNSLNGNITGDNSAIIATFNGVNTGQTSILAGGNANSILAPTGVGSFGHSIMGGHNNVIGATAGESAAIINSNSSTIDGVGTHLVIIASAGSVNSSTSSTAAIISASAATITGNSSGSVILGGIGNTITNSRDSYALGAFATVNNLHSNSYIINQNPGVPLGTIAPNSYTASFPNGYRLFSNAANTTGVSLPTGANAWVAISDSTTKKNIVPVVNSEIYNKFRNIDVFTYQVDNNCKLDISEELQAQLSEIESKLVNYDTTDAECETLIAKKATIYKTCTVDVNRTFIGVMADHVNAEFSDVFTPYQVETVGGVKHALSDNSLINILWGVVRELITKVEALEGNAAK